MSTKKDEEWVEINAAAAPEAPVADQSLVTAERILASVTVSETARRPGAVKILVVDDSATIRMMVASALKAFGYRAVQAKDGRDGLETLRQNPDAALILCDINMPIMDGLTMIEIVRKAPAFGRIPVVMLTTESAKEAVIRAKACGVSGWLIKPPTNEALRSVMNKVVERKAS